MNVEVDDVEDKIRRALSNPNIEDSAVITVPKPKNKAKKKISYTKVLKILFYAMILSIFYLARYDELFNMQTTGVVLRAEKILSIELGIFRKVFAIKHKLNTDEFVRATKNGNIALATSFLEWGLDPNAKEVTGDTLLIVAIKQDKSDIIEALLHKGANANLQNQSGEYPLDFSSPSQIELLVKSGADINVRDLSQKTRLIKSAMKNDFDSIKVLVKAGADPNLQDSLGKTALHYAFENKNTEIMNYLKSIGSEQNIVDKSGQKAMLEEDLEDNKFKPVVKETYLPSSKQTAVRVMGKVLGVWQSESDIILAEINAEVRNVGDYPAKNVIIKVKIPGAGEVQLNGPSELPPYTTITYKATPQLAVTRAGDLKATATCENCHK